VRWFSHFAREGRVFAFLQPVSGGTNTLATLQGAPEDMRCTYRVATDADGCALLWKVKPADFSDVASRRPAWSPEVQLIVLEARRRLMERGLQGDDVGALSTELRWSRQALSSHRNEMRNLLSNLPVLREQEAAAVYLQRLATIGELLSSGARSPDALPPAAPLLVSAVVPLIVLVLVSMPGAGKSTLAKKLLAVAPKQWARVNQDEMGSRKVGYR
jgi:hypothetical protein